MASSIEGLADELVEGDRGGRVHRLAGELRTGTVWVNTMLLFDPAVPFGGYRMSGWGREMGEHSLEEYLNVKSVWISTD